MPAHKRATITKHFPGLGKPKGKKIEKWEKVGEVGVDAGMVWLGDPCYILHRDKEAPLPKALGEDWGDFCGKLVDDCRGVTQFNYDKGHAGLGVCVSSGYGDGCYDVEVQRTDEGRVRAVRIVFIEE